MRFMEGQLLKGTVYQERIYCDGNQITAGRFGYQADRTVGSDIPDFEKDTISELAEVLAKSSIDFTSIQNLPNAKILKVPNPSGQGFRIHLREELSRLQLEELAMEYSKHVT